MRCPCACQMDQYGMSGEIDINTITQYLGITIVILIAVYACVDCFVLMCINVIIGTRKQALEEEQCIIQACESDEEVRYTYIICM